MVVAAELKKEGKDADGELTLVVLTLDLRWRRFLIIRLKRLPAFRTDPESPEVSESESELLLEESEEDEESIMSAKIPGWDSASIISCGILSYM
jgi:hypothetical protein